jgi:hypothetical protein
MAIPMYQCTSLSQMNLNHLTWITTDIIGIKLNVISTKSRWQTNGVTSLLDGTAPIQKVETGIRICLYTQAEPIHFPKQAFNYQIIVMLLVLSTKLLTMLVYIMKRDKIPSLKKVHILVIGKFRLSIGQLKCHIWP